MPEKIVVVGAQWGDEGKGKIVDALSKNINTVVRYNGGGNAGHTIIVGKNKHILHILPSNITRSGVNALVGPGVVCDLEVIREELALAKQCGSTVVLDRSAPVVLPLHKLIDGAREASASEEKKLGTTKRGIGPCYEDLVSRRGIKLGDLTSESRVRSALTERGYYDERCAVAVHHGAEPMTLDETVTWCMSFSADMVPYLADTRSLASLLIHNGKSVLFEGAQGVMLDVLQGSRPYCTSSHCTAGGASAAMGVYNFDRVVGIAKAYLTRVGAGPFPTELNDFKGALLRSKGHEFGSTTGRPRRCGWLDLVALRYACRVGGVTELALTKLDVLSGLSEIQMCTDYAFEGAALDDFETLTSRVLKESECLYHRHKGWKEDITGIRKISKLPLNARKYIAYIQDYLQIPITMVSVGPEREQIALP